MNEEENIIKIEYFEDESTDRHDVPVPAQALITLHDSVQNMPSKQKTELQVAVADASPLKRSRLNSMEGIPSHVHYPHFRLKQTSPMKFYDPRRVPTSEFSQDQFEVMNKNLTSINNTLKQSTGRRWAYYEWFYSNIDRALLLGTNDFEACLHQMFKKLKTRMLTRSQWSLIRRMMGKPRRCSAAFLKEERHLLEEKRKKIRYLHQLKGFEVTDMIQFKDLPDEIPMPMVIGTKVTAKVPTAFSKDGLSLFTGTVDAVDNVNNTYRINFDREGIGSHSIPDTDVASAEYEAMNLQLFMIKERPKIVGTNSPDTLNAQRKAEKDDLVNSSPARMQLKEALNDKSNGTYGGFPIRFLLQITSLSKAIVLKKQYVDHLREMNSDAELRQPFGGVTKDFQKNYARVVLELDKLNNEMDDIFRRIETFIHTESPQLGTLDQSLIARNRCNEDAAELIDQSHQVVIDDKMRLLVLRFTSLMLQINHVAKREEPCSAKLLLLDESVKDIKKSLCPDNRRIFEDKVETSIAFLKNRLQDNQSILAGFTNRKQRIKRASMAFDDISSMEEVFEDEEEGEEEIEDDDIEEEEEIKEENFEIY